MNRVSPHGRWRINAISPFPINAILVSLALATFFTLCIPGQLLLVTAAMWLLAFALGLLSVALFTRSAQRERLWGSLLGGQLLGVVAITLLFLASLR